MTDLEQAIQAVEQGLKKPKSAGRKMQLAKRMAYYKVPGFSVALLEQGELAWAKGYGVMEANTEKLVTTETIFQAASISKPVAAIVALQMVEAGQLELDTDVNEFLQTWKVKENKHTQVHKVTLRGLLSHTAGINIHGYPGYPSGSELPTTQQILNGKPPATSKTVRVTQPPGTEFKYSGGGYIIVHQIIEDVTGRSLADLAQELIFDRLGMANSTFEHLLPEVYKPQTAIAHNRTGEPIPGKWHTYPEGAPASLWSTPSDLIRLMVEVYKSFHGTSNVLLSSKMTREMLTPQIDIGGLGFNIIMVDGQARFGHPGWNEGFHSLVIGDAVTGQGFCWMANGENGRKLGRELTRGLSEVFDWTW